MSQYSSFSTQINNRWVRLKPRPRCSSNKFKVWVPNWSPQLTVAARWPRLNQPESAGVVGDAAKRPQLGAKSEEAQPQVEVGVQVGAELAAGGGEGKAVGAAVKTRIT